MQVAELKFVDAVAIRAVFTAELAAVAALQEECARERAVRIEHRPGWHRFIGSGRLVAFLHGGRSSPDVQMQG
jgi:hypothetical protein